MPALWLGVGYAPRRPSGRGGPLPRAKRGPFLARESAPRQRPVPLSGGGLRRVAPTRGGVQRLERSATALDPQEQVRVCLVRVSPVQTRLMDRGQGRQIFGVIPGGGGVGRVKESSRRQRAPVGECVDDRKKCDVGIWPQEFEARFGTRDVEPALLHEALVLLRVNQGEDVDARIEVVLRGKADDIRIDERLPKLATQGDTMVAIDHEVGAADLIDGDRREVTGRIGLAQGAQPRFEVRAARPEVAVEVDRPIERPQDPIDRDRTHADVALIDKAEPLPDLGEWEQRGRRERHRVSISIQLSRSYSWNRRGGAGVTGRTSRAWAGGVACYGRKISPCSGRGGRTVVTARPALP